MGNGVIIAVGGTGGHLFPAMALARSLRSERPDLPIFFLGGGLKHNPYFDKELFPFADIASAAPFGSGWKKTLKSLPKLIKGTFSSLREIRKQKPALIVGFGSFHAFPPLLASQLLGIPLLLHESNAIPGRVNRLFSSRARLTALYFDQAAAYLKGKSAVVGMPLREECYRSVSREDALKYYSLDPQKKTVLIFGGSQGALALNKIVTQSLPLLSDTERNNLQFLHFTGNEPEADRMQQVYNQLGIQAAVKSFEPQMAYAWNLADLLVSRSGAGTISEQFHFAVPALFIPYPYASDAHQEKNARFVADIVNGAEVILEKDLNSELFAQKLKGFLDKDSQCWAMRKASLVAHKINTPMNSLAALIGQLLDTGEI